VRCSFDRLFGKTSDGTVADCVASACFVSGGIGVAEGRVDVKLIHGWGCEEGR